MSNPFDNNYFNSIFSSAFSHPFFQQNNPMNNQQFQQQQQQPDPNNPNNPNQNNINFNMNNYMTYNGQPYPSQQQQQSNQQPNNNTSYNYSNNNLFNNKKNNNDNHNAASDKKNKDRKDSDYYKDQGNNLYQQGKYNEAIDSYSKAIAQDNTYSTYYSNRANCYKKLKQLSDAQQDIQTSLELDDKNIKANLICGQIMAEQAKKADDTSKIENAINKIAKALRLCSGQGKHDFQKQLVIYMLRARKLLWYKNKELQQNATIHQYNVIKDSIEINQNINKEQKEEALENLASTYKKLISDQTDYNIPDYLCCRITLELMTEPYIDQAGITYEGDMLKTHIESNGNIDPTTREPISKEQIYPNVNIKQAIQSFIEQNPWSFEYIYNENYQDIEF